MKVDGIAKLYDTLSVDERFRLRLQALARRDMVDCERLDRSCPSREYRAYTARIDASDVLTLCTLADLLPKLAKLQMVTAFRPLVEYLEDRVQAAAAYGYVLGQQDGWDAAGGCGDPPELTDDDLDAVTRRVAPTTRSFGDVLDEMVAEIAPKARMTRDGLATVAQDQLGVGLDVLLGAWARHSMTTLSAHADALDAAPVNPDDLALFTRVLALAWRKHGLLDASAEPDEDLREAIRSDGWDVP